MEFFDRKQEVLDIEITPLGKRLLQMGEFHPIYYAFYDHDILYGSAYVGLNEAQNDIETRIQETPRLKQQVYLYSAEEKINKNTADTYGVDFATLNENLFQDVSLEGSQKLTEEYGPEVLEKKQYELEKFGPLGTMAYTTNYTPAWDINFFSAPLTGSITILTGSHNLKIPRLQCDIQYKIKIFELSDVPALLDEAEDPDTALADLSDSLISHGDNITEDPFYSNFASPITEDGTYLSIREEPFFIKTIENNTEFLNENVDIEMYQLLENGEEKRLYFSESGDRTEDPEFVEYYFDILSDSEIPDFYYCTAVGQEKLVATYTDKFIFNCQDLIIPGTSAEIYDIPDNPDAELCE